jgi:CRP-like cAMP-binding protein
MDSTVVNTEPFISNVVKQRCFERRELIPTRDNILWQIELGAVKAVSSDENGMPMILGYWGVGDIIGYPLSKIQPYYLECSTYVEAVIIPIQALSQNLDALLLHIQQIEKLTSVVNCKSLSTRIWDFLLFLSDKFGRELEYGRLIDLFITHQEIADVLNTTRVTVTRILQQFEAEGKLQRHKRKLILPM